MTAVTTRKERTATSIPPWLLRHGGLLAVLALVATFATLQSDVFLTTPNLVNVLRQVSVVAVLAAGLTALMTAGGIDFSLGSQAAVVHAALAQLIAAGVGGWTAVALALLLGTTFGLINGAVIAGSGVAPFVVTLATATALDGTALIIMRGQTVSVGDTLRGLSSEVAGIPVLLVIAVVVCLAVGLMLRFTSLGRAAYAIGGNEAAARLSGIPVLRSKLFLYGMNGFLAGLAGVMLLARLGAASPGTGGLALELTVVAAVVIGGTSLAGGSGTVLGTVLGVLLIGVVENSLNLLQVSPYYHGVAVGLILLCAAVTNQIRRRRQQ